MNTVNTFEHKGVSVKIIIDEDAQSPQEDADNGLFLVANHREFYVPEPGQKRIGDDWETLHARYKKTHWVFPIEAYIHSGVCLAFSHVGNFPDRQWDVSQVGAIFAAKSEWRLSAKARKAAEGLLETWNQYLGGEVYGFVCDDDGLHEDSCWGFYGLEYCEEQARESAERIAKKREQETTEAHRCACADIATV